MNEQIKFKNYLHVRYYPDKFGLIDYSGKITLSKTEEETADSILFKDIPFEFIEIVGDKIFVYSSYDHSRNKGKLLAYYELGSVYLIIHAKPLKTGIVDFGHYKGKEKDASVG